MAVALGEQRHQHVGAGHFLAARRLDMDGGALDDALEAGGRQRLARVLGDDALEAVVDEGLEIVPQAVDIDAAGLENRHRVVVLGHRQQQVLEGRDIHGGARRRARRRGGGTSRGSWTAWTSNHLDWKNELLCIDYSFSNVHWRGCWFLRA